MHWLDSNFIPMDSKKFGFQNFDYIIRFAIKNESEIEKLRSRDRRILQKNRICKFFNNQFWNRKWYNFYLWYQCEWELNFLVFQNEIHRLQYCPNHFHFLHFSAFCGNSVNMPFLCCPQAMRLDALDTIFKGVKYLKVVFWRS